MSKKIKCAIKFVRALLTNFHIKLFGLKEDKTQNLLGIAIMLIGRYSGHFGKLWLWELDARVEIILNISGH